MKTYKLVPIESVKAIGTVSGKVYDLEVANTHTFFANDILVHNSCHITLESLVKKMFDGKDVTDHQIVTFIDKFMATRIDKAIKVGYEWMADLLNAKENAMKMKREKICVNSIYKAKKQYTMAVLNSENVVYAEPKISITGMAPVRSTTPDVCKTALKKAFKLALLKDEKSLQEFVTEFKSEFLKLPAEEIGKVSGTDDFTDYLGKNGALFASGTPAHVKGCLVFNDMIKKRGLQDKYPLIQGGDKIKFVYLKLPNPSMYNVVAFAGMMPPELGLEKYIDYEKQFVTVFLKTIDDLAKLSNWSAKHVDTLDDFFS